MLRTGLLVLWMVLVLPACGGDEDATDGNVDTLRVDTVAVVDSLIDGPVEDTLEMNGDMEGGGPDAGNAEGAGPDAGDAPTVDDAPPPIEEDDVMETEPDEPTTQPGDAAGAPPLPARYQLASVEGESLPVIIGEGPECDLQLVHGDLRIEESLAFVLRATIHEVCAGERESENLHSAEGTVERDGSGLLFEARYDSLFGTARGRYLPEGHIVIETLETEGGEQEVEWRFLR